MHNICNRLLLLLPLQQLLPPMLLPPPPLLFGAQCCAAVVCGPFYCPQLSSPLPLHVCTSLPPSVLSPAAYGLTLVWALVAVFEHTDSTDTKRTSLAAIIVLAILSVASVLRRPGAQQPESSHDHDARQPLRPSLDEP